MKLKDVEKTLELLEKNVTYIKADRLRTYHADSAAHLYQRYSDALEIDEEDFMAKTSIIFKKFFDLEKRFIEMSYTYSSANQSYVSILFRKIGNAKKSIEREEERKIELENKKSFMELCALVVETIKKTGILDKLLFQENRSLKELGLYQFISEKEMEEYKENLLSPKMLEHSMSTSDEIRNNAVCVFWLNKIAKVMNDCMLGYMLEKRAALRKKEDSKETNTITEEDKAIAILRLNFMKEFFRYCDTTFGRAKIPENEFRDYQAPNGMYFNFLEYMRYRIYKNKILESQETLEEYYKENPDEEVFYANLPREFQEKADEFERRYNELFKDEDITEDLSFSHDAFLIGKICDLQNAIYNLKTEVTSVLVFSILLESKLRVAPYCRVWGVAKDDQQTTVDSNFSSILYIELPGFMKPLMVHIDNSLLESLETSSISLPEYDGIFRRKNMVQKDTYLSANVLLQPNERERTELSKTVKKMKETLRQEKKKIKAMPEGMDKTLAEKVWLRNCKYYGVLEYMDSMVKDKSRKIEPGK